MAGVDASKVLVGAPDQTGVSGAILRAPLGTALPTDARSSIDNEFTGGGYVSSDGVTVTPELSTTSITDWSGAEVRKLLESFTGTVKFQLIQFDAAGATLMFGEQNVTVTQATATTGTQVAIAIGGELPDAGSWVFKMKDGKALIRIVLPNAQPTTWDEMTFVNNAPIPLGTELACYPDSDGKAIYIYTDDGVFSA